jgi:hypothetical protein
MLDDGDAMGRSFPRVPKHLEFGAASLFCDSCPKQQNKTVSQTRSQKRFQIPKCYQVIAGSFRRSRAEVGQKCKKKCEMRVSKTGVGVTSLLVESEHIDSVAFYFFLPCFALLYLSSPFLRFICVLLFFERPLRPSHRATEVVARCRRWNLACLFRG